MPNNTHTNNTNTNNTIGQRKADHLDLCATDDVAFRQRTTLLEHVRLIHQSLPDMALDDIDTRVTLCGKTLRAPIVIAAMTGGHPRAAEINQGLARIAERRGYAFGLGSQRAMDRDPSAAWTYRVRDMAPNALIFGNLGVVQARDMTTPHVQELVQAIDADALCLHMNPAMELIQPGGDRDFSGGLQTFARLAPQVSVPVIAKETGNGISAQTAANLRAVGISYIDTSGAGGTSWVGVETLRATGAAERLGQQLWDWGVPTAASVCFCVQHGMTTIATGGLKHGLDLARAIALGATAGGMARAVLQAFIRDGEQGADTFLTEVEDELRAIMLLVGAKTIAKLQQAPRMVTGELKDWVAMTNR